MLSNPSQYSPQGLMPLFPQFANSQFGNDTAFAQNPLQGLFAAQAGAHIPVQQIVPVLGALAQQIAVQSAVAQQIGAAVHQLAHQLAVQGLQGYPAGGFGAGQAFGGGQPYTGGAHPLGLGAGAYGSFNPQAQPWGPQGAYGGFNPQAQAWGPQGQAWGPQGQAWGANRSQTIQ